MDPEGEELFIWKDSEDEIFSEDGLYAVRVENGGITYTALIPDDHVVLSVEAFIEYLERLGFKVVRE